MKQVIVLLFILFCYSATAKAQTPEQIRSWLPTVEGWKLSDQTEVFSPDNLFNRINGSAPLFLENNFREMTALEYTRGDDYVTIQVYRHATPEDAFGMYASERSSDLKHYPIGGEAQGDSTNLYFFADCLYVKMWANGDDATGTAMFEVAGTFARNINPKAGYPAVLDAFPATGKIPYSDTYITSNYLGHEFLKGIYLADYSHEGRKFQVFVMDARTPEAARETLAKYYAFCKQTVQPEEGFQTIADRYNGDIPLLWQGRYLAGIYSEEGTVPPDAGNFLKAFIPLP